MFEKAVKKTGGKFGAIDLFWRGVLLVEHKSPNERRSNLTDDANI